MDEVGATIVLAWLSGLILGIGAGTDQLQLIIVGAFITLFGVFYYRKFASKYLNNNKTTCSRNNS